VCDWVSPVSLCVCVCVCVCSGSQKRNKDRNTLTQYLQSARVLLLHCWIYCWLTSLNIPAHTHTHTHSHTHWWQKNQRDLETEQNIQFIANMLIQWSVYSSNYKISSCDALSFIFIIIIIIIFLWVQTVEMSRTLFQFDNNTHTPLRLSDQRFTVNDGYLHSFPPRTRERRKGGGATGAALEPHWPILPSIIRKTLAPWEWTENMRNGS